MSYLGKSSGTDGPPVRLGDIAKARMGKTILSKELTQSGVPVYSAGRENEPWGYISSSDLLFGDETIVIAARGNIGFPRVPRNTPFISTQTTIAISLKDSRHVPYLCYQLETVNWREMTSQTTIPMVTVRQVEGIEVSLPPLPEQHRIVAEIEKQFTRLDAGVSALKRVQGNLKRYRAAVLKAACEGKLVPTEAELAERTRSYESGSELLTRILAERRKNWIGRGQYKEPAPIEPGALPITPEGWTFTSAEAVCSSVRDGTHDTPAYVQAGVPLITSKNLLPTGLDFDNVKLVSREDHIEIGKRSSVERGDILFAMIGTIGNPVVVETDREFSIKNVGLFKANADFILSRYLRYWFMSPPFTRWLEPKQRGTTQKFAPLGLLRGFAIALPPLAEQIRIVAEVERRLSVVDELEATVSANLQRAVRLRQAVLQKAFTGELMS